MRTELYIPVLSEMNVFQYNCLTDKSCGLVQSGLQNFPSTTLTLDHIFLGKLTTKRLIVFFIIYLINKYNISLGVGLK